MEAVGFLGQCCLSDWMQWWIQMPSCSQMQKTFRVVGTRGRQKPSKGVNVVLEKALRATHAGPREKVLAKILLFCLVLCVFK